jgi:hypothetical protein
MFEWYAFVIPLVLIIVVVTIVYVMHSSRLILVFTEPGCGHAHTLLFAASARISMFSFFLRYPSDIGEWIDK